MLYALGFHVLTSSHLYNDPSFYTLPASSYFMDSAFYELQSTGPGHLSATILFEVQKVPESFVPDNLLQKLASVGGTELPPVCAIVGGILGQELIKAMSCKGEPLKNFFFFDASDGKGIIECVVPSQMNDH
jgi:hypothetical protein